MSKLEGNELISAIASAIKGKLVPDKITAVTYDGKLINPVKPFAFVHLVNFEHSKEMNNRARWDYLVDVRVHLDERKPDIKSWSTKMGVELLGLLGTLYLDSGLVRAREMEFKVEEGVLHLIAKYSLRVTSVGSKDPLMDNAAYGQHIKQ